METFTRFLYEFLSQFFSGLTTILSGIWDGIKQIFNINSYKMILEAYKNDLSVPEWILVGIAIFCIVLFIVLVILLIYLLIRKYLKFRKQAINQDELLEEVANLNGKVASLIKEKEDILAMKVSQLGLQPGESSEIETEENDDNKANASDTRFAKLESIDEEFANYKIKNYGNNFTLPELCENFRNFAASKLKLYYTLDMMRLFVSALASTKLVILQGISGTGKTSLAYAWGKFMKHDSCVASVQPSWRDRTELFRIF